MRRAAILRGMARAFFAEGWAQQIEEAGQGAMLSGREIMDLLPAATDPAALHAARTLLFDMERANGGIPIERIYEAQPGPLSPKQWGHYAAMEAMGHGVGLFDEIDDCTVNVPTVEFGGYALERDYTLTPEETR